jgi:PAS domain-containing protein
MFARVWPSYLTLTRIGLPALALLMETIVERRRLANERARFRAVLDDPTDAIRIVDADTQAILDCNRADCELSGLSREQMLGRDSTSFWPSPARITAREEKLVETGPPPPGGRGGCCSRARAAACSRWTAPGASSSTVITATRS